MDGEVCALRINYRLVGAGWAECDVTLNGKAVKLTASYLSDALGQLAAAALIIRMGAPSARVSFDEEPGEYRWGFDPSGGDDAGVRIRIWWFEELWSGLPDEEGQLLLDNVVGSYCFYNSVLDALDDVLSTHGVEGYAEKWDEDQPFPTSLHQELGRLVCKWPGRRAPGS